MGEPLADAVLVVECVAVALIDEELELEGVSDHDVVELNEVVVEGDAEVDTVLEADVELVSDADWLPVGEPLADAVPEAE